MVVEGNLTVSEDLGAAGEDPAEHENPRAQWVLESHGRWIQRRRLWEGLSSEARGWLNDTVQQEGGSLELSSREKSELEAFRGPSGSWEKDAKEWDEELVPLSEHMRETREEKERQRMDNEETTEIVSQLVDEIALACRNELQAEQARGF